MCLLAILLSSCLDDTISFLDEKIEVDSSAQKVTLNTSNKITKVEIDCTTTGADSLSVDAKKENDIHVVYSDWFKIKYKFYGTSVDIELEENNTGEERHIVLIALRFAYGTYAVVSQRPKE